MRARSLALALLALGAIAAAAPRGRDRRAKKPAAANRTRVRSSAPDLGTVTYLTAGRAYLDRGRDEGLAVGAELALERRGQKAATCTVDSVGDHSATCVGAGVRLGDAFRARPRGASAQAAGEVGPDRAIPSVGEQTRVLAAVQAAPVKLVAFGGGPVMVAAQRGFTAEARLNDYSWFNGGSNFHQERADVLVRGAPLPLGLRLDVDASAVAWTHRPSRFLSPLTSTSQVWVRQAAVSSREPDRNITFALGRLWPYGAPGIAAMDGAQVGYRFGDGSLEAGAFGGGVPDPLTTAPTLQRTAFGGYVMGRLGDRNMLLTHEARLSLMSAPEFGSRFEGVERVHAFLFRTLDVGAEVRFGLGGAQAPWAVDAARLSADWRLGDTLRVDGALRYAGNEAIDLLTIGAAASGTRSLHADASVSYSPTPWMTVTALGSGARDLEELVGRALFGAEVALPSTFGAAGGLSLGWIEERGWISGRAPYVQVNVQPWRALRLLSRLTYVDQAATSSVGLGPVTEDLSLFVSAEYAVTRWLTARVLAAGRTQVPNFDGEESALRAPNGLTVQASLGANL